jgi:hypothetical protein
MRRRSGANTEPVVVVAEEEAERSIHESKCALCQSKRIVDPLSRTLFRVIGYTTSILLRDGHIVLGFERR